MKQISIFFRTFFLFTLLLLTSKGLRAEFLKRYIPVTPVSVTQEKNVYGYCRPAEDQGYSVKCYDASPYIQKYVEPYYRREYFKMVYMLFNGLKVSITHIENYDKNKYMVYFHLTADLFSVGYERELIYPYPHHSGWGKSETSNPVIKFSTRIIRNEPGSDTLYGFYSSIDNYSSNITCWYPSGVARGYYWNCTDEAHKHIKNGIKSCLNESAQCNLIISSRQFNQVTFFQKYFRQSYYLHYQDW